MVWADSPSYNTAYGADALRCPSFCTKSVRPEKSHFVSDSRKESWLVCKPVASLACITGNSGVRSRDEKPNGKGSHSQTQGKAKDGMVNEKRIFASVVITGCRNMADTAVMGHIRKGGFSEPCAHTVGPGVKKTLTRSHLTNAEQDNPNGVWPQPVTEP